MEDIFKQMQTLNEAVAKAFKDGREQGGLKERAFLAKVLKDLQSAWKGGLNQADVREIIKEIEERLED